MKNQMNNIYQSFVISLTFLISFFLAETLNAQVCGISGGKLTVPDAGTLQTGNFEFEPSFSVFRTSEKIIDQSSGNQVTGKQFSSNVLIRITSGIDQNFEAGATFASTIEQVSAGLKYTCIKSEKFRFALISGGSLPAGNNFIPDTLTDDEHHSTFSLGAIGSIQSNEKMSLDLIFSYSRILGTHPYHSILNYGVSAGYLLSEKFQAVVEINGFSNINSKVYSYKISIFPGFTYKVSDKLLFVLGFQNDLAVNKEKTGFGYFAAFTISF